MGTTRRGLANTFGSAALAAVIVAAPALAQESSDSRPEVTPASVSSPSDSIPILRGGHAYEKDVVRVATARASNDRIAVAIYGQDDEFLRNTARAIRTMREEGDDVVLVIGTLSEPANVDVFVDGQLYTRDNAMVPSDNSYVELLVLLRDARGYLAESLEYDRQRDERMQTSALTRTND